MDQPVVIEVIEGVAIFKYQENLYMSLDVAKETVRIRKEIINAPYVGVLYIDNIRGVSKRAREYLVLPEASEGTIAAAFICKSIISAMIANFFLTVNTPLVPTRVFSSEEKAFLWIKRWINS